MRILSLGRWSTAAGRWFVRERIYLRNGRWTPIVKVRLRYSDKLWLWLAYRLPRELVYWCAIRVAAHATTGKWGAQIVSDLRYMDALDRWGKS